MTSDTEPIAWRAIVSGAPVLASDGKPLGSVREVLGSDAEDLFHGLRVSPADGKHDVMVGANDITSITRAAVVTALTPGEVAALPAFGDVASYHLASVGSLRKHLGWERDSKTDGKPG